jgi:phosphate transport system protein
MEQEHIVKSYDIELSTLRQLLLNMLDLNVRQLNDLYLAISEHNNDLANKIVERDTEINKLDTEVVDLSVGIFGLRNPVARDLRFVFSASHIARNCERIGDNSRNIAKKLIELTHFNEKLEIKILESIHISTEMIRDVIDILDSTEIDNIMSIVGKDLKIDDLYNQISNMILQKISTDPEQLTSLHDYLLMSRYLERIGDHIVNICKYITYTETGSFLNK